MQAADGSKVPLADYAGKYLLIVNVASKCGLTPQYTGLEALQRELGERGLQVLGFPCNQFGGQEPGSAEEIQQFCSTSYGVASRCSRRSRSTATHADPLYEYLRAAKPGDISWNFTKFLVGPDGEVLERFEPRTTPEELRPEVEAALAA